MGFAAGLVLAYCGILLAAVIIISKIGGGKETPANVNNFIFAGGKVPSPILAPSVFNSWVWVTTIVGAAETSIEYGVSGGIAYALGAVIAFAILILLLLKFKDIMPEGVFVSQFMRRRFSEKTGNIFQILMIMMALYMLIEMAAGIGFVFYGLFGVSFKAVAFFTAMIAVVFVVTAGMKGVLCSDLFSFIFIVLSFGVLSAIIISKFDLLQIYQGMYEVQSNPEHSHYNESVLQPVVKGAVRYFIAAIPIALAQITIDPGYFLKAYIAKDKKAMKRAFTLSGIVLFSPVALLSTFTFGYTVLILDLDLSEGLNSSVVISSAMLLEHFGLAPRLLAGFMLLVISMTTMISSLMGTMGVAALDIHPSSINKEGTDLEKIRFARIFTVLVGLVGALISISLESVSIMTIDIFCGIVFSSFFGSILMGFLSEKKLGSAAIYASVLGAVSGFLCWVFITDTNIDWFIGTIVSFAMPIILISFGGLFVHDKFNFASLKFKK